MFGWSLVVDLVRAGVFADATARLYRAHGIGPLPRGAVGAALVATAAMSIGGPPGNRGAVAISALVTLYIAWRMTASVALYWVASGSVGAVQALVLRRSSDTAAIT